MLHLFNNFFFAFILSNIMYIPHFKYILYYIEIIVTPHRIGGNRKCLNILSTNKDKKSIETEFLIAICHLTGDQWQSKSLFLEIFDPRSSIAKSVFDCRLPGVNSFDTNMVFNNREECKVICNILCATFHRSR